MKTRRNPKTRTKGEKNEKQNKTKTKENKRKGKQREETAATAKHHWTDKPFLTAREKITGYVPCAVEFHACHGTSHQSRVDKASRKPGPYESFPKPRDYCGGGGGGGGRVVGRALTPLIWI